MLYAWHYLMVIGAARTAFEDSINQELMDKLNEIIKIIEQKGYHSLVDDIEKLKIKN